MNRALVALAAAGALVGLAGCADGYYGSDYGHRRVAYYENHPVGYDGYYDGHYGPFYDGYWSDGGTFYYSTGEGRPYVADREGHFRREGGDGYTNFHGGRYTGDRGH